MSVSGLLRGVARDGAKRVLRPLLRRWTPRRADLPPATWRLTRDAGGALALDGLPLQGILDRAGGPVFLVDAARLDDNAARFLARPPGASRPCEVYASYKTNPVPGVLRRLHRRGLGAEVVSAFELWLALRLGVAPSAIVYNGPVKSEESLRLAVERGLGLVNVNARSEIAPLAALARAAGRRVRVGVRVSTPHGWSGQFGEPIAGGAALQAFREALAAPELEVVALHSHLGGEIASRDRLDAFVGSVLDFAGELRAALGLELQILDLGGSLACPTVAHLSGRDRRLATTFGCDLPPRDPAAVLGIDAYLARVTELVEKRYAADRKPVPRIFLEPGRALTGNTQMLLCRVHQVRDPDEAGITWAALDAGINVAESVRGEFHQLFPLQARPGPARLHRLAGPTCTPGDVLYLAWSLPALRPGDGLAIMDAGAYFVPYSTSFSYPQPGVVLVEGGREQPLRRPQTFEDVVSRDLALEAG